MEQPSRLLDLGCGTGSHAMCFAEDGLQVVGIDYSDNMIAIAQGKRAQAPVWLSDRLVFQQGDARKVRLGKKFDVVVSLFHVASYQVQDADVLKFFKTANAHCQSDGVFIFDCWFGPAVVTDPPVNKTRTIPTDNGHLLRRTEVSMDIQAHTVKVDFTLEQYTGEKKQPGVIKEQHLMRYFFTEELEQLLNQAGMQIRHIYRWMSQDPASEASWFAVIVAQPLNSHSCN